MQNCPAAGQKDEPPAPPPDRRCPREHRLGGAASVFLSRSWKRTYIGNAAKGRYEPKTTDAAGRTNVRYRSVFNLASVFLHEPLKPVP